jgi:hypothetical protein
MSKREYHLEKLTTRSAQKLKPSCLFVDGVDVCASRRARERLSERGVEVLGAARLGGGRYRTAREMYVLVDLSNDAVDSRRSTSSTNRGGIT